jgi:hypothetical protein
MKKPWSKISFAPLTLEQKDLLLGLALTLLLAGMYYAQWGYYLTSVTDSKINVDFPQKYFWWADDSRDYRLTGDWLFGRSQETVIEARPWVYPLYVGLARTLFGSGAEKILWLSQFVMWLASCGLIYLTLYNATRKVILGILGATLFFTHPSPLVLTFHGMTETLNILLLCLFCWLLSTQARTRYLLAIFLLSLLTTTKPTYQIQLVLLVIYVAVQTFRKLGWPRLKHIGLLLLVLLPIWIQFAISFSYNRTLSISNIGPQTFKNYLVAIVYEHIENQEWRPSMEAIKDWDLQQQLFYLWAHQRETILTYRRNLIDNNQWIGSFFIRGENNRMIGFVETVNAFALYAHLFMLPLMFYFLFSEKYKDNKELVALIYAVFLIQTLASGISTGQEDRLTVTGVPLAILAYLLVFNAVFSVSPALPTKKTEI